MASFVEQNLIVHYS